MSEIRRLAYSPDEAREALGFRDIKIIYELIHRGELRARKIGRVYRIQARSLEALIDGGAK